MHTLKLNFFFSLLLFFPITVFSQTIKGEIKNTKGEKILLANVIIRDSVESEDILEFVVARNGEYSIILQENYKRFIVEITANKYTKEYVELGNLNKGDTYIRNFVLQAENEQIEEVVIKVKKNPFSVNEDTTKFDVKGYSDGTERKIEEILKKLPGIQVNEKTGEIKYKNKSIETIKLDGDDLFGANYSIGSRNINVDMVEQIQAIENYSDNPLLKGIENSDKVILNLKLKKGLDVSGDITFGQGVMENKKFAHNVGSTLLAVTKKYKSFGAVSYNNIGVNRTPFNYFDGYNPEQLKDKDFFATKIIPEQSFGSVLEDKRVNINNTLFGSYNQTFKVSKRINVKNSFYYISDKITSLQSYTNDININNQIFRTSDNYIIEKKPVQYRGDLDLKINTSALSLLEYKVKARQENIFTPINVVQNEVNNFRTELLSEDTYFKQSALLTQKISDKKALQVSVIHTIDKISQNFILQPSVYEPIIYNLDRQISNTNKKLLEGKATLLGNYKQSKYTLVAGANTEQNSIITQLEGINDNIDIINGFTNDLDYQKNTFFNVGTYRFRVKKWILSSAYTLSYLQQKLKNKIDNQVNRNTFVFEPSFRFSRKINDVSTLDFSYNYSQKPFSEEYFYNNSIILSSRIIKKNTPDLQFNKQHTSGVSYNINDLYNQFLLLSGISQSFIEGNYFSNLDIANNRTQIVYFYLPQNTIRTNAFIISEKYISKAHLLVKGNVNYSIQTYNNIVNASELRRNQSQNLNTNLELKTAFDIKVNFQNITTYNRMVSKSVGNASFINESINNSFTAVYKQSKRSYASITADYFIPNINKRSENYFFLDANYTINSKDRNYSIDFMIKNLLNTSNFEQVNTSDYSVNIFRSNLLPRYGMIRVSCNF